MNVSHLLGSADGHHRLSWRWQRVVRCVVCRDVWRFKTMTCHLGNYIIDSGTGDYPQRHQPFAGQRIQLREPEFVTDGTSSFCYLTAGHRQDSGLWEGTAI